MNNLTRPNDDKTNEQPTAVATAPPANTEAGKVIPAAAKADQVGRVSESYTERERRFALARLATNHRAATAMLDRQRFGFMWNLSVAINTRGFKVTDWEFQFVNDLVRSPRPFTDPQRDSMDDLRRKYEHRLKS